MAASSSRPYDACLRWLLLGLGLGSLGFIGCEEPPGGGDSQPAVAEERVSADEGGAAGTEEHRREWAPPESVTLSRKRAVGAGEWRLTEARRFEPCRSYFEPQGQIAETYPLEGARAAEVLAGCGIEAYQNIDTGRWVAWSIPLAGTRAGNGGQPGRGKASDLRLAHYGPDGGLQWHWRMDRSRFADNFVANYRRSFVTPLLPRLVCAGTLWEAKTQVGCLDVESGELEWSGVLKFWSAIPLQRLETSLVGADISGITRRYPYSGTEMRRREFGALGGHSAMYATDGDRLFFVPREGKGTTLTAWDFETMERAWSVELPGRPQKGLGGRAFAEHGLVVFSIDDTVYGLDAESGEQLWALDLAEEDAAWVSMGARAAGEGEEDATLYLLASGESGDNLMWAVEPRTGEVKEQGTVPAGSLHVKAIDGQVLVTGVRAVQRLLSGEGTAER